MPNTLNEFVALGTTSPGAGMGEALSSGLETGMKLARTQQELEMQKQQVEGQKAELEEKKWSSAKGLIGTYLRASPVVQKAMKKQTQQRLIQVGGDPTILDLASDPETAQIYRRALEFDSKDPIKAADGMQAIGQASFFDDHAKEFVFQRSKMREAELLAKIKADTAAHVADKRAEAAGNVAGIKEENSGRAEFQRITNSPELKPLLQTHAQGAKDLSLINTALTNGEGIPVQTLHELSAGMANMITNGRSALTDRQAQEMSNLQTRFAEIANKASTEGVQTVNDQKLFGQLKDQFERLMDATEKTAQATAGKLKRPAKNDYLNQQQDAALENISGQLSTNKKTAKGSPGKQNAPKLNVKNFVSAGMSHGYKPEEIKAEAIRQGASAEEVDAALRGN